MLIRNIKRAGIGFLLGMVMCSAISLMMMGPAPQLFIPVSNELVEKCGSLGTALLVQLIASGIYGSICFVSMAFYEIESWSLARASASHCLTIVLCYIPIGLMLDWASKPVEFLIIVGIQIISYFIVWLIIYLIYNKQVNDLNEMIKKSQK